MIRALLLLPYYFAWHYSRAFRDIFRVWMNFLWFIWHFFSIGLLMRTLFSPWQRLGESYKKGFDPTEIISTFIVNTLMRIVGVFIRIWVVLAGLIALVLGIAGGILFYILWIFMPLVVFLLIAQGFFLLFS